MHIYIYIYIYIHTYRERDRCMYIYIYMYREREIMRIYGKLERPRRRPCLCPGRRKREMRHS